MYIDIEMETLKVLEKIRSHSELSNYVDDDLKPPKVFGGEAPVRLIILGQDPTVKKTERRKTITTVLNLNRKGALKNYVIKICKHLDLDFDNDIYATNFFKNFFKDPPARDKMEYIFSEFKKVWLPLLQRELSCFRNVPIISLGDPILGALVKDATTNSIKIREYWDYNLRTKMSNRNFKYIEADINVINRPIFPFPHQPSLSKPFYRDTLEQYLYFLKRSSIYN